MKLVDSTTNLATALLTAGVASYLMGMYVITTNTTEQEDQSGKTIMKPSTVDIPERLQVAFTVVVAIVAMSNITGVPRTLVNEHWENTIFGDKFFPSHCCTVRQKRVMAGILEAIGLCLTITCQRGNGLTVIRAFGYGVIFVMYGRGTMINTRITLGKTMFTLLVASTAAFLMSAEMQNYFALEEVIDNHSGSSGAGTGSSGAASTE